MERTMEAKKRPKILIADDDPQTGELLEAFLSVEFDILKAYDGEEALDIARRELPDLVLLDIIMPKLNGYEVCKKLKNSEDTRSIPVVIITALKDLEERIKGIVGGSDNFLTKPIRKIELLARVKFIYKTCLKRNTAKTPSPPILKPYGRTFPVFNESIFQEK